MGKYVKVHPALIEKPATDDFKNENKIWSHVIRDGGGNGVFFGDYDYNPVDFDFDRFRLQIGDENGYRAFSWPQARELGETIVALANKYEGKE